MENKLKDMIMIKYKFNQSQYNLFNYMLNNKEWFSINDLATIQNKDRTTIQKLIKILIDKKLIDKSQVNLNSGFCLKYKIKNIVILDIVRELIILRNKINKIIEEL